jgi:hypothetical protein
MKNRTVVCALALLVSAFFLGSCGSGEGADSADDLYEYVTQWYLPDTDGDATANLATMSDYIFVSVCNIGEEDNIYWYSAGGTLAKDILGVITDEDNKPYQVAGVSFYGGFLYAADSSGGSVWKIDPVNPNTTSNKVITYTSSYPNELAVRGTNFYATRSDSSVNNWTVDRRNAGDTTADYAYALGDDADLLGIALDSSGNVYVAARADQKVYKLSAALGYIDAWGINESAGNTMFGPRDVAVDGDDNVFVLDPAYYRVLVYDTDGNCLGKFGSSGTGDGQFSSAISLAASPDGYVYVADYQGSTGKTRVMKFQAK